MSDNIEWDRVHHDRPERHVFGAGLGLPTFPKSPGTPGKSPVPAREDHTHGDSGGFDMWRTFWQNDNLTEYYAYISGQQIYDTPSTIRQINQKGYSWPLLSDNGHGSLEPWFQHSGDSWCFFKRLGNIFMATGSIDLDFTADPAYTTLPAPITLFNAWWINFFDLPLGIYHDSELMIPTPIGFQPLITNCNFTKSLQYAVRQYDTGKQEYLDGLFGVPDFGWPAFPIGTMSIYGVMPGTGSGRSREFGYQLWGYGTGAEWDLAVLVGNRICWLWMNDTGTAGSADDAVLGGLPWRTYSYASDSLGGIKEIIIAFQVSCFMYRDWLRWDPTWPIPDDYITQQNAFDPEFQLNIEPWISIDEPATTSKVASVFWVNAGTVA